MTLSRVLVATVLAACIASPTAALAAPKPGRWTGRVTDHAGTLTFKVAHRGGRLTSFRFRGKYGSLHCGGSTGVSPTIGSTTVFLPHARVKHGHITATRVHDAGGLHEKDILRGTIGHRKAHGTLKQIFTGAENCGTGTLSWTARFGKKPPPAGGPTGGGGSGPSPIANAHFAGMDAQGHALSMNVTAAGDAFSTVTLDKLDLTCVDGTGVVVSDLEVDAVPIESDGSFSFSQTFSSGATFSGNGRVARDSAQGLLGGTYTQPGGVQCQSGNVSFDLPRG